MKTKKIKYSESDMAALIKQVEDEFSQHLAKAEEQSEEVVEETAAEEAPEVEAKADEETSVEKSEETVSEAELDYDDEDFAEMDQLYASMSKSEAEAHLKSLQKTLGVSEEAEEVVEETAEEEVIAKSEEESKDEAEETLHKSELEARNEEIRKLKDQNQKLEKSLEGLTAAMTKFIKRAPKQKAVTQIQYVAKSEEEVESKKDEKEDVAKLSKSEISKRLSAKIRGGQLEKAERDQINAFYEDGQKDIESIKHLL